MAGEVEQNDLYMDFEEFLEEEHEGNGDESEESGDEESGVRTEDAGDVRRGRAS